MKNFFLKSVPVIFAWGVNENLFELAKMTKELIGEITPIGLNKNGYEYAYYHPLPQNYTKQKEWVKKITDMIKKAHNKGCKPCGGCDDLGAAEPARGLP